MSDPIKSICPYCGVGCGILASKDESGNLKIRGDADHPANRGNLCLKGASVALTVNVPNRMRYCMIADRPGHPHVVPAEAAVQFAARRLEEVLQHHGPSAIAFYLSGQLTTEAQYVFNKLAKGALRTNHVDSNSRLCMSSAASGMSLSLGSDGPPTCYDDINLADAFFFIGSNAADCHPVLFDRVRKRMNGNDIPCIVADPRKTTTASAATLHLPVRPRTDLVLLNGLLRMLRGWNCLDEKFIASHTRGWAELNELLNAYPAHRVVAECGIEMEDFLTAARIIADAERFLTFWTMGVNQTMQGTFTSNAIINLHLATGRIGKPGAGPFSLTGQPNAMGGRDVGYMSHLLPGQRLIANAEHRREMEKFWNLRAGAIGERPGHDAVAMFNALARRELRAIWIVGSNPAATMPDLPSVRKALKTAELVIVQDAYFPTETTRFAHALFPAAVNLEQSGTFCNSERSVSLMNPIANPPGDARPDWQWGVDIARQMGFSAGFKFENAAQIFDEFARSTAGRPNDQSGLSHEILAKHGPTQWPALAGKGGNRRRFGDGKFCFPDGRARLLARDYLPADEKPTADFPMLLTTGRIASQWHTRTKTGNVAQLSRLDPEPFIQINPQDAAELGLADRALVTIHSRRGKSISRLRIDPEMPAGLLFAPMHWNDLWQKGASPNEVTTDASDPISHQPALKLCAVRIAAVVEKLAGAP